MRQLLLVTAMLSFAAAGRVVADEVRYYEQNGVTYCETRRVVQQRVPQTRIEQRPQTVYRQEFATEVRETPRTYWTPVTEYQTQTYLAGRWGFALTVVSVGAQVSPALLDRARQYLEAHGVQASYIEEPHEATRKPARVLLFNAEKCQADLIIMGGYESGLLRESLFGSTVDHVLRSSHIPVLICQ